MTLSETMSFKKGNFSEYCSLIEKRNELERKVRKLNDSADWEEDSLSVFPEGSTGKDAERRAMHERLLTECNRRKDEALRELEDVKKKIAEMQTMAVC